MSWVVDSSFVCSLFLPDEKSTGVEAIFSDVLDSSLKAPILLKYEVANAVRSAVRRGRITPAVAMEILPLFLDLPIEYDPLDNTSRASRILELALDHDLSVYDATYLELALHTNSGLLALDRKLQEICRQKDVPVIEV